LPSSLLGHNPYVLAGTTVAYVHYPTISDDMVKSVNCGAVAPNNIKGGRSVLKLAYYHFICRPMFVIVIVIHHHYYPCSSSS
jgi:hypothetical protein